MALRTLLVSLAVLTGCTASAADTTSVEGPTGSTASATSYSTSTGVAWGYADRPSATTPYSPPAAFSHNSAGGSITITRTGLGTYRVLVANFGDFGGHGQVVAYGDAGEYCRSHGVGWDSSHVNQQMNVSCADKNGAPFDSQFVFFIAKHAAATEGPQNHYGAYLSSIDYDIAGPYRSPREDWNSTGAENWVTRTGVGVYSARLPGITDGGGSAMVTAMPAPVYGSQFYRCKVGNFTTDSTATTVIVRCFDNAGPHDGNFALYYSARKTYQYTTMYDAAIGGYVWGNNPTSASYTPSSTYQFINANSRYSTATAQRLSMGQYRVRYNDMFYNTMDIPPSDTTLVTSYGATNDYCQVRSWWPSGFAFEGNISCWSAAGVRADAQYLHTYISGRMLNPA